jgi:hypothetical protein
VRPRAKSMSSTGWPVSRRRAAPRTTPA